MSAPKTLRASVGSNATRDDERKRRITPVVLPGYLPPFCRYTTGPTLSYLKELEADSALAAAAEEDTAGSDGEDKENEPPNKRRKSVSWALQLEV